MAETVVLEGMQELERSLSRSVPLIYKGLRVGLLAAAEPVKRDAERLAASGVSGMGRSKKKPPPWSIQRVGQTQHEVYIAPKERSQRARHDPALRRPLFALTMLEKSYEPAFARNRAEIVETVDIALNTALSEL